MLERSWSSRGATKSTYFGTFARMGRLRLMARAHFRSHNGAPYRVIYSPASKIVWALEPIADQ